MSFMYIRTVLTVVTMCALISGGWIPAYAMQESDKTVIAEAEWVRIWDARSGDEIEVDSDGNIYVAGFGPCLDGDYIYIKKFEPNGSLQWERKWKAESSNRNPGFIVAPSGHIYIAGDLNDRGGFDPASGKVTNVLGDASKSESFLCKYDSDGDLLWARVWGVRSRYSDIYDIAVNSQEEILVTGIFTGIWDFDPGPSIVEFRSQKEGEFYLCKYNADGEFQWVKTGIGGYHVLTDPLDNIYLDSWGTKRLNPLGELVWHSKECYGTAMTVDDSHNIYITGLFPKSHLQKVDSAGLIVWSREWDSFEAGDGWTGINDIALSPNGGIYITGGYTGNVDFCPGPGVEKHTAGGLRTGGCNTFLAHYSSNGEYQWVICWDEEDNGALRENLGRGVVIDIEGYIYLTGAFYPYQWQSTQQSPIDFDPGPGVNYGDSENGGAFLIKLKP